MKTRNDTAFEFKSEDYWAPNGTSCPLLGYRMYLDTGQKEPRRMGSGRHVRLLQANSHVPAPHWELPRIRGICKYKF